MITETKFRFQRACCIGIDRIYKLLSRIRMRWARTAGIGPGTGLIISSGLPFLMDLVDRETIYAENF